MSPDALRPVFAWVVVGLLVAETLWSHRNERRLRAQGAREPDGDVYGLLRMAYPAGFVCAIAEGMLAGVPGAAAAGMLVFALAKAPRRPWAMASLGERWCFRLLRVPPGSRPLFTGPPGGCGIPTTSPSHSSSRASPSCSAPGEVVRWPWRASCG